MTNEHIINAFKYLKQEKIKVSAFNIIGVPGETIHTVLDTIRLNALVKPTHYINAYFNAFQGTDLYKYCLDKGIQIKEVGSSLFAKPTVILDTITEQQMIFGFKYFPVFVKIYKLLYRMPKSIFNFFNNGIEKIISYKYFPYRFFNIIYIFDISTITYVLGKVPILFNFIHWVRRKIK